MTVVWTVVTKDLKSVVERVAMMAQKVDLMVDLTVPKVGL